MTVPTPTRSRWRLEVEAVLAGLLWGTVVAGLVLLVSHLSGFGDAPDLRWIVLVAGTLTGVLVAASYLKNRGIQS